ncbi:MAG: glyceraldehyde-3-phosphate dehydrogenase [Gaiellaceae bacterium]|nr:MAG: glyceraldehyde-3-phosphate dehydrogenase [Gaiellaceae bacterium]
MTPVRVAVNGYGVIGKRVADAVALQPDMELVGVADVATDYRVRLALERGYRLFGSTAEAAAAMREAGLEPAGDLGALLAASDVVVDATPKRVGAANKPAYEAAGVKAIFQGGEKHELAGVSFVAQANYAEALGRDFVRVVSCNTTGLVRVLGALRSEGLLERARAVLIRRGTDPWESHLGGLVNTLLPEPKVPSHQGPDARTVLPDLDLVTIAAAGPFNLSHVHFAVVEAPRETTEEEVFAALRAAPRIVLVRAGEGVEAPNSVIEIVRDLGRPRGDLWEVAVWEDSLAVSGREIFLTYQVHNEAIVTPENVDAIRAVTAAERDPASSIALTDETLGIRTELIPVAATAGERV